MIAYFLNAENTTIENIDYTGSKTVDINSYQNAITRETTYNGISYKWCTKSENYSTSSYQHTRLYYGTWKFKVTGYSKVTKVIVFYHDYQTGIEYTKETVPYCEKEVTNFNATDGTFSIEINGSKDYVTNTDGTSVALGNYPFGDNVKSPLYFIVGETSTKTRYTVTENLTNIIASSSNPKEVEENASFTLSYLTDTNVKITSLTCNIGTVEISDTKQSATITGIATENIIVNGIAEIPKTNYTITENISNCTSDNTLKEIEENSNITITYTANTGYEISNCVSNIGNVIISDDKSTATVTVTNIQSNLVNTVSATEKVVAKTVHITGTIENATCNYTDGEEVNPDKPIIITANNGYEFVGDFTYREDYGTNFFSNTGVTLTANVNSRYDYYLNSNYIATRKAVVTTSNFIRLYNPTREELDELATQRFSKNADETITDYGSYITKLYNYPIDISEIISDKISIVLGILSSTTKSNSISTYIHEIDLGTIHINNLYDIDTVSIFIIVPLFDKIRITENEFIIGCDISANIKVNLYTGMAYLYIKSSFNNDLIYTDSKKVGADIPYISEYENSNISIGDYIPDTNIDTFKIEVVKNQIITEKDGANNEN